MKYSVQCNVSCFVFTGQVDWAALAQAWIAQKESTGVPDQPGIQPNGQEMPNIEPPAHNNHGAFPGDPNFGRGWQPGEKP